jgi:UTP--glucose-1-phosphate uridylyltransferase
VEEALASRIEQIVFVTGSGKTSLENHFDRQYELEDTLRRKGKVDLLQWNQSLVPKWSYRTFLGIRSIS